MTEPPAVPIPLADPVAPEPAPQVAPAAPPPRKAPPDTLTLRAAPRRVVRFKRGVIIGGVAAGSFAIAGVAWMALGPKTFQLVQSSDKAVAERRTPPDAVANLPGSYGEVAPGVPVLGPPLPGDLGRPILDRQRQLEAGGGVPGGPGAAPPTMTPQEQAAEAERQRIAAQAAQAREA